MNRPTVSMSTIREMWTERQREWIERWAETHDLDFCPLHGFWKLGPKNGGLLILACPGCPSLTFEEASNLL